MKDKKRGKIKFISILTGVLLVSSCSFGTGIFGAGVDIDDLPENIAVEADLATGEVTGIAGGSVASVDYAESDEVLSSAKMQSNGGGVCCSEPGTNSYTADINMTEYSGSGNGTGGGGGDNADDVDPWTDNFPDELGGGGAFMRWKDPVTKVPTVLYFYGKPDRKSWCMGTRTLDVTYSQGFFDEERCEKVIFDETGEMKLNMDVSQNFSYSPWVDPYNHDENLTAAFKMIVGFGMSKVSRKNTAGWSTNYIEYPVSLGLPLFGESDKPASSGTGIGYAEYTNGVSVETLDFDVYARDIRVQNEETNIKMLYLGNSSNQNGSLFRTASRNAIFLNHNSSSEAMIGYEVSNDSSDQELRTSQSSLAGNISFYLGRDIAHSLIFKAKYSGDYTLEQDPVSGLPTESTLCLDFSYLSADGVSATTVANYGYPEDYSRRTCVTLLKEVADTDGGTDGGTDGSTDGGTDGNTTIVETESSGSGLKGACTIEEYPDKGAPSLPTFDYSFSMTYEGDSFADLNYQDDFITAAIVVGEQILPYYGATGNCMIGYLKRTFFANYTGAYSNSGSGCDTVDESIYGQVLSVAWFASSNNIYTEVSELKSLSTDYSWNMRVLCTPETPPTSFCTIEEYPDKGAPSLPTFDYSFSMTYEGDSFADLNYQDDFITAAIVVGNSILPYYGVSGGCMGKYAKGLFANYTGAYSNSGSGCDTVDESIYGQVLSVAWFASSNNIYTEVSELKSLSTDYSWNMRVLCTDNYTSETTTDPDPTDTNTTTGGGN